MTDRQREGGVSLAPLLLSYGATVAVIWLLTPAAEAVEHLVGREATQTIDRLLLISVLGAGFTGAYLSTRNS